MNRSVARLPLVLLPALLLAERALTQPVTSRLDTLSPGYSSLSIRTDPDSAVIIFDGRRVGDTPLTLDSLAPGMHHLKVVHSDLSNWLTGSISDSVSLAPGEQKTLSYRLWGGFSINSTPSGASLLISDSVAGLTPLTLWLDSTQRSSLIIIRKEGFHQVVFNPAEATRGFVNIGLSPEGRTDVSSPSGQGSPVGVERSSLRLYLTGAATILSGAGAAYLKNRADEHQAHYLSSGDPSQLAERNRLDSWSGVLLAITQVGFSLFTYFLLSQ